MTICGRLRSQTKKLMRQFPKERFVCKYDRELACDWMILIAFGLATMHSFWWSAAGSSGFAKNVTKIYCEVN